MDGGGGKAVLRFLRSLSESLSEFLFFRMTLMSRKHCSWLSWNKPFVGLHFLSFFVGDGHFAWGVREGR